MLPWVEEPPADCIVERLDESVTSAERGTAAAEKIPEQARTVGLAVDDPATAGRTAESPPATIRGPDRRQCIFQ